MNEDELKKDKASPSELRRHVEFLASIQPARQFGNIASLDAAARYITEEFKRLGLDTHQQEYIAAGDTHRNVVALLGPKNGPRVVIGAHYDVAGEQPGADDNASGVAGVLELARLMMPLANRLPHPLELVAYTLEESPNFASDSMGSQVHAQALARAGVAVKLMMSLEMIGYFVDTPKSQQFPLPGLGLIYPTVGNFIGLVGRPSEIALMHRIRKLFKSGTNLPTESINAPRFVTGIDLSDHASYWDQNYSAIMVTDTAFMRNPHYHKKSDRPETLDYVRMAEVVHGVCHVAMHI